MTLIQLCECEWLAIRCPASLYIFKRWTPSRLRCEVTTKNAACFTPWFLKDSMILDARWFPVKNAPSPKGASSKVRAISCEKSLTETKSVMVNTSTFLHKLMIGYSEMSAHTRRISTGYQTKISIVHTTNVAVASNQVIAMTAMGINSPAWLP